VVVSNPDEYAGSQVDITGQLLDAPEADGDQTAFQMFVDAVDAEQNTLVRTTDPDARTLGSDAYVRVRGEVAGEFEGENAFGGTVTAVGIDAEEVERAEAVDVIDPTIKTVTVGQTRTVEGYSITLEKLEFGRHNTRAFVSARNDGYKTAKLDLYKTKLIQGQDRIGQNDPYDYSMPKPRTNLKPGEQTEGVVIFRRADPAKPLQASFEWEHGGYTSPNPAPLVFQVSP